MIYVCILTEAELIVGGCLHNEIAVEAFHTNYEENNWKHLNRIIPPKHQTLFVLAE